MSRFTPSQLVDLLQFMAGKEPANMAEQEKNEFRQDMLNRFAQATTFVSEIVGDVMGEYANNFMPAVVPGNFAGDWIGYYSLQDASRAERFLDAPEPVRLLSTMVKPIEIKLHLFAEANHPGYAHRPHLELSIECTDDPELALLEDAVTHFGSELQKTLEGAKCFEVMSYEGAMVRIENPPDIVAAVKAAAEAVRREAREDPDWGFIETMALKVKLDATTPPEIISEAVRAGVFMMYAISRASD